MTLFFTFLVSTFTEQDQTMAYKLGLSAEKGWRKLREFRRLADVINGIKFIDEIDEETVERQKSAA
jgi:putative transposase